MSNDRYDSLCKDCIRPKGGRFQVSEDEKGAGSCEYDRP